MLSEKNQSLTEYLKLFKAQCDVMMYSGERPGTIKVYTLYQQTVRDLMKRKGKTIESKELCDE